MSAGGEEGEACGGGLGDLGGGGYWSMGMQGGRCSWGVRVAWQHLAAEQVAHDLALVVLAKVLEQPAARDEEVHLVRVRVRVSLP